MMVIQWMKSNDKFAHFICNFLIVVILGIIFNPVIGLAGAVIASFCKETYDEFTENKFVNILLHLMYFFIIFLLYIINNIFTFTEHSLKSNKEQILYFYSEYPVKSINCNLLNKYYLLWKI